MILSIFGGQNLLFPFPPTREIFELKKIAFLRIQKHFFGKADRNKVMARDAKRKLTYLVETSYVEKLKSTKKEFPILNGLNRIINSILS